MVDTITSHSPLETWQAGKSLAATLPQGAVVALCGDLGAGKTQFCRGLLAGLGGDPDEVTSPTFTLVHEYTSARLPVFHFDFYRLEAEAELAGIGWNDFLQTDGVLIVEWADKFPGSLPRETLWVRFRFGKETVRFLEVES
jgi:tRNA threonylcarbamoyladenosine biosynthesis protein TsaE